MELEELYKHADEYPLNESTPAEMPDLTFWPFILAFGVLFFFWGIITSLIISGVGILIIIVSVAGWIQDLNHEIE